MEFGVLGTLLVRDGAEVRAIPSAKQRVLLAALLLRHGQPTPLELLADTIWDGCPPPSAPTTLRNYVMRLRQGLGAAGERIETRAGGYLFRVDSGELDVQRFADLRGLGLAALRGGESARAVTLLDQALALWRGPALVDVPSDTLRRDEVERLTEARLTVLEWRLEAELRLGRHADVVAELRALTSAHPGRERFWAQLMTALYRGGRQSEALAAYQRVRRILDQEFGVGPGPELREVHQRILDADPELAGPAAAEPRMVPVTPFQLPPEVADFTGRESEMARLSAELAGDRRRRPLLAVVSGQPGVGKSAFTVQVAHAVRGAFPNGVLFADLRGTARSPARPDEVLRDFLLSLGVAAEAVPVGLAARTALYRSLLSGRRLLVVLDDARDGAQVEPLLPSGPGCAALVSSRHRLAELVGAERVELAELTEQEAGLLLARAVGRIRVAAEPAAAAELVARCAGLPLALRICAARLTTRHSWSLRHLADRLAERHCLLDELRVGSLDLRAAFARSTDALEPRAARAFRLLSLQQAPIHRVEAAALLGESLQQAERLLEQLVDAHLLTAPAAGEYRYPALLREFAREQSRLRDAPHTHSRTLMSRVA